MTTDTFQNQYFVNLSFKMASDYSFFPNLISSMLEGELKHNVWSTKLVFSVDLMCTGSPL